MTEYKTHDEVPESWLDRCSGDGYERFTDEEGNRRYKDNGTHDGYIQFDDGRTLRGRFTVEPAPDGWECVIDVQEIIRCRDCKHFDMNVDEYIGEDGSNPKCNRLTYVFEKYHGGVKWLHRPTVSPDGFCAWAERDA